MDKKIKVGDLVRVSQNTNTLGLGKVLELNDTEARVKILEFFQVLPFYLHELEPTTETEQKKYFKDRLRG